MGKGAGELFPELKAKFAAKRKFFLDYYGDSTTIKRERERET